MMRWGVVLIVAAMFASFGLAALWDRHQRKGKW